MNRLESLLELLKAESDDVFLNYALGMEYAALQRRDVAEQQFRKVLALDPGYLGAYYQLGKLLEAWKTSAAMEIYREGLEKARIKKDHKAVNEFEEAIFLLED